MKTLSQKIEGTIGTHSFNKMERASSNGKLSEVAFDLFEIRNTRSAMKARRYSCAVPTYHGAGELRSLFWPRRGIMQTTATTQRRWQMAGTKTKSSGGSCSVQRAMEITAFQIVGDSIASVR
jgi:hypothetical protein